MKRLLPIVAFAILSAAMLSCGNVERQRALLARADSLLEAAPDSAQRLLIADSALICSAGEAERAWYAMSRTEADDKCFVRHASDSAIRAATKYYGKKGNALQKARSWYLLGRVKHDMQLYGSALSAFENAMEVEAGGDSAVCRYIARACTWTGDIYEDREIHAKALAYNKSAYEYAVRSDVPSLVVYSLRDIGRSYRNLKENKVAIKYYRQAAEKAQAMNNIYLYNMVMEELAGIYVEERMLDEAKRALLTPFDSDLDIDIAPHYFTWGLYFETKGEKDSALYNYKKCMEHGSNSTKRNMSLRIARIYEKAKDSVNAFKYYNLYSTYVCRLESERLIEAKDFLENVERKLDLKQQNMSLVKTKIRLQWLLFLILSVSFAVTFVSYSIYKKKKRMEREQRERVKKYWKDKRLQDRSIIRKNEERIKQLENELTSSSEKITEMQRLLLKSEADLLEKTNEQMRSEQKHEDMLVADLENSDIYRLFHKDTFSPENKDFAMLKDALNMAYDRFTFRLKELYPTMRNDEVLICCLVKINLPSKRICSILCCRASTLSMARTRLYYKIFNKKGSATDFDNFIRTF